MCDRATDKSVCMQLRPLMRASTPSFPSPSILFSCSSVKPDRLPAMSGGVISDIGGGGGRSTKSIIDGINGGKVEKGGGSVNWVVVVVELFAVIMVESQFC